MVELSKVGRIRGPIVFDWIADGTTPILAPGLAKTA
jgi:hypothetical protein